MSFPPWKMQTEQPQIARPWPETLCWLNTAAGPQLQVPRCWMNMGTPFLLQPGQNHNPTKRSSKWVGDKIFQTFWLDLSGKALVEPITLMKSVHCEKAQYIWFILHSPKSQFPLQGFIICTAYNTLYPWTLIEGSIRKINMIQSHDLLWLATSHISWHYYIKIIVQHFGEQLGEKIDTLMSARSIRSWSQQPISLA